MYGLSPRTELQIPKTSVQIPVGSWHCGSPTIGPSGIIWCTPAGGGFDQLLKAYSPDGEELWRFTFENANLSRPTISLDGTAFIVASQSQLKDPTDVPECILYAFDEAGNVRWKQQYPGTRASHFPVCDSAGAVYSVVGSALHKFSASGTVIWTVPIQSFSGSMLALCNHTLYFVDGDGWQSCIRAVSCNGESLWELKAPFNVQEIERGIRKSLEDKYGIERAKNIVFHANYAPPAFEDRFTVTAAGSLIVANQDDCLYSISAQGMINWRLKRDTAVQMETNGEVVAAYVTWQEDLYAITESGVVLRKQPGHFKTTPIVNGNGQVFVAAMHEASAFEANGDLIWHEPIQGIPGPFPALTPSGEFCVATNWGYLHILK